MDLITEMIVKMEKEIKFYEENCGSYDGFCKKRALESALTSLKQYTKDSIYYPNK